MSEATARIAEHRCIRFRFQVYVLDQGFEDSPPWSGTYEGAVETDVPVSGDSSLAIPSLKRFAPE